MVPFDVRMMGSDEENWDLILLDFNLAMVHFVIVSDGIGLMCLMSSYQG